MKTLRALLPLTLVGLLSCGTETVSTSSDDLLTQNTSTSYGRLENTIYDVAGPRREVNPEITSIAIVADTSGSMQGRKNTALKKAFEETCQELAFEIESGKQIELAIYAFSGGYKPNVVTLDSMGPFDYARCVDVARSLGVDAGTPLGLSISYATKELNEFGNGRRNIMLMTDGKNENGETPLDIFQALKDYEQTLPEYQRTELYVVAFETDVGYFNPMMDLGAIVRDAQGVKELRDTLLGNVKMMLEAPDPNAKIDDRD